MFYEERPYLGGVGLDFGIDAVFRCLAPGFIFGVGAAGQMAEVGSVRADSDSVCEAAWR